MAGDERLIFRRNRLPQWRLGEGIYHPVWHLQGQDDELEPAERTIVADSICLFNGESYQLSIYCVMDTHVHVLLQGKPAYDMSDVLKNFKGPTAYAINDLRKRRGQLWQKVSHTQLMPSQRAIDNCRRYIYNNPKERWGIEPYTYSWLKVFE